MIQNSYFFRTVKIEVNAANPQLPLTPAEVFEDSAVTFIIIGVPRAHGKQTITGVSVGSDAFFPFSDNIERAKKSGVKYIAEPGGSIRDDQVIAQADEYGMTIAFNGIRLFHH